MQPLKSLTVLSLVVVFAVFISNPSHADEEFSKQYKVEQLRNSAKLLKLAAFTEGVLGGLFVYAGVLMSDTGGSGAVYYGLGGVSVIGAFYTWNSAEANEREAKRMEQELIRKGLLHWENGKIALHFPRLTMHPIYDRQVPEQKSVETKIAFFTYHF